MKTLYIFCLLSSVVVLAVDKEEPPVTEVSTLNGFQCPTCQSLTSGSCENKPAICHGEEKLCVDSTGNIQNEGKEVSAFVTKGCVTQLALQALLGTENVNPGTTYTLTSVTVTEAQVVPTETPSTEASNQPPESSEKPDEKPTTEKPTTEEPTTEKPTTEEPTTEKPTTEEPTTEEPTTEEPTTEKPTAEKPTAEKPTKPTPEKTTSKGNPHISRGLSFALWLPIMSSVLWMMLFS